MKKLYTSPEYKKWQRVKTLRIQRRLKAENLTVKKSRPSFKRKKSANSFRPAYDIKLPVIAPQDLRLMENLEECLEFFRELRNEDNLSRRGHLRFVVMSLKQVTQIDYGTISILTSLNDDLKYQRILLKTFLPDNSDCKKFMIDSGYLNNLVDDNGRPFPKAEKSDLIFFEKGTAYMSSQDGQRISTIIKNVVGHLTGEPEYSPATRTVVLEICGNSIEWSATRNKQWLLGIKYEDNKVIFTVTDVGRGILDTLNRRFTKRFFDTFKSCDEILKGAFEKKYGSTTQEENRNKGLPAVKSNFDLGKIRNLKVLTNNVILHFDDHSLSKELKRGAARFKGTFYQWEMTNECLAVLTINE